MNFLVSVLFWVSVLLCVSVILCTNHVIASTAIAKDTSVVQFLEPKHGVLFNEVGSVCFVNGNRIIHLRYDYGPAYSSFNEVYNQIITKLGAYGSDHDSALAIRKRVCDKSVRVSGTCPKGKSLTEQEARLRNKLYELLDEVHETSDDNFNSWKAFSTSESNISAFPTSELTQDLELRGNTLFGAVNSPYGEQRDVMSVFDTAMNFSNSGNELVDQFLILGHLLLSQLARFQEIRGVIQQLDKGLFPSEFVSFTSLQLELKNLFQNQVTEAELPLLQQLLERQALTLTTQVGDCTAATNPVCKVDIITIIPTLDAGKKLMHASTFPIAMEGYLKGLTWKRIQLSPQLFIPIQEEKNIFHVNSLFSRCQSAVPFRDCNFCNDPFVFQSSTSPCLKGLYFDNSTSHCTWQAESPANTLQTVSAHKIISIDNTPGELLANCNGSSSLHELSPASLLTLNPSCMYELHDRGNDLIKSALLARNLIIKGKEVIHNQNLYNDIDAVQRHFQNFGYIYVLSFGSLLLLLFVCFCGVCMCKFKKYRMRRRVSAAPSVRYTPMAVSDNQQLLTPVPRIRPRVSLRGPIIRELPSGIQISSV
jgi:hypothetical protein